MISLHFQVAIPLRYFITIIYKNKETKRSEDKLIAKQGTETDHGDIHIALHNWSPDRA